MQDLLMLASSASKTIGTEWSTSDIPIDTQELETVGVSANGLAFGANSSSAYYSADGGITWVNRTTTLPGVVKSVIYVAPNYYALYRSNILLRSSDSGVTWDQLSVFGAHNITYIAYSGSVYCAVGDAGAVYTSTDGTSWTYRSGLSSGTWGAGFPTAIIWASSKFILIGAGGKCATSPDGITWTYRSSYATAMSATASHNPQGLVNSASIIVAAATDTGQGSRIATSTDGITWTARTSLTSSSWGTQPITSLAYSTTSGFVVVGRKTVVGSSYVATATSSDGITWVDRGTKPMALANSASRWTGYAEYGSNRVLIGVCRDSQLDPILYRMPYGGQAAEQPSFTNTYYAASTPLHVAYGSSENELVVVGTNSSVSNSVDGGITWTNQNSLRTINISDPTLLIYTGAVFISAGAGGKIASSPTGVTWTNRTSAAVTAGWPSGADIYCGARSSTVSIFGGASTKLLRCTNTAGTAWAVSTSNLVSSNVISIVYAGLLNKFIALTSDLLIHHSSDAGITWGHAGYLLDMANFDPNNSWVRLVYTGITLWAVNSTGQLAKSSDGGITWTYLGGVRDQNGFGQSSSTDLHNKYGWLGGTVGIAVGGGSSSNDIFIAPTRGASGLIVNGFTETPGPYIGYKEFTNVYIDSLSYIKLHNFGTTIALSTAYGTLLKYAPSTFSWSVLSPYFNEYGYPKNALSVQGILHNGEAITSYVGGGLLRSTDGISWSVDTSIRSTPMLAKLAPYSVRTSGAYVQSMVGHGDTVVLQDFQFDTDGGTRKQLFATLTNGIPYQHAHTHPVMYRLIVNPDVPSQRFVRFRAELSADYSSIQYSSNGLDWYTSNTLSSYSQWTTPSTMRVDSLVWDGARYIAYGYNSSGSTLAISTDLVTWTFNTSLIPLYGTELGPGDYMLKVSKGIYYLWARDGCRVLRSTDLSNWVEASPDRWSGEYPTYGYNMLEYGNYLMINTDSGNIVQSKNSGAEGTWSLNNVLYYTPGWGSLVISDLIPMSDRLVALTYGKSAVSFK